MPKLEKRSKVALITGGAKRLGAAITQSLHEKGFRVAIGCSQSLSLANQLALNLNKVDADSAKVFAGDLNDTASLSELASGVIAWQGRIDLLINNAACFYDDKAENDWQAQFGLNVMAPYFLSEATAAALQKTQGSIINIADVYGLEPKDGYAIYSMTKAALISQTKSLAARYAPLVRVNAICPGAMLWPSDESHSEKEKAAIFERCLLPKLGGEQPIVKAVSYLVDNDFVTNTILRVDGGHR